jgi:uncharacterized protein (TIGR00730 family)
MPSIHSVAVFCGARSGTNPAHAAAARELGAGLAANGIRLVYGGGRVGIMGTLADAVLAGGGQVLGVIPEFLTQQEVAHPGVQEMVVTSSMHSRKQHMAEQADAFVSMPGGLGTLDETVEIMTWRLLRLHDKPILLCDVEGSAAPLNALIEAVIAQGFAGPEARDTFERVSGVPALLDRLRALPPGPASSAARL